MHPILPQTTLVELHTDEGPVFSREAEALELRAHDGVVTVVPWQGNLMTLGASSEVTLRTPTGFLHYRLHEATALLADHHVSIRAKRAEPLDGTTATPPHHRRPGSSHALPLAP